MNIDRKIRLLCFLEKLLPHEIQRKTIPRKKKKGEFWLSGERFD
jgi:hypothetical protein